MTKYSASLKARRLWFSAGFATIRRKSVVDRFEVGYYRNEQRVVLGAGATWEIAFSRALSRPTPE